MQEAFIGLVAALGVVIIEGAINYAINRRDRKDKLEDKKSDRDDKILTAIKDLKTDVDGIKKDIINVRVEVERTREEVNGNILEESVIQSRVRILRFADEMACGQPHSKDHFDQILDDITKYENYCGSHPNFRNDITRASIELIRESFRERMKKHDFLTDNQKQNKE